MTFAPIDPNSPGFNLGDAAPRMASVEVPGNPARKGGMFGGGGKGDFLKKFAMYYGAAQGNPLGLAMMQMQQQKQQREQDQEDYQRKLGDQKSTWLWQKQWERDNPNPINNDTVNDYNFRVQTLGKQAADDWLKTQSDPIVNVTLPGNRFYSGPRSGLAAALGGAGGAPAAPTSPVGKLTPIDDGGPTQPASGGFRP
jgi:hypothetical protein